MGCFECGGEVELRIHRHEEKVGALRVKDGTGMVPTCTQCGEVWLSAAHLQMYELRAAALVLREAQPEKIDGKVLRYARKALGLRQTDLGARLGHAPETISRYENDATEVPAHYSMALLGLLDKAWMERMTGDPRDSGTPTNELEVRKLQSACG